MKNVTQDIKDSVKTYQHKVLENFEVARLENILIFKIDDRPILGINTSNYSNTPRLFITLNL